MKNSSGSGHDGDCGLIPSLLPHGCGCGEADRIVQSTYAKCGNVLYQNTDHQRASRDLPRDPVPVRLALRLVRRDRDRLQRILLRDLDLIADAALECETVELPLDVGDLTRVFKAVQGWARLCC